MTDTTQAMSSKQEAIEEMEKVIDEAFGMGEENKDDLFAPHSMAEALYDRIAALREFPEEGFNAIVEHVFASGIQWANDSAVPSLEASDLITKEAVQDAKLLWQGEPLSIFDPSEDAWRNPSPTVGGNTPEQKRQDDINKATNKARSRVLAKIAQDKPKGTCGTCGGSGKLWSYGRYKATCNAPGTRTHKCPACGGTGECQHKNIQNIQTDLISLYCDDCKQYVQDRRSGDERREPFKYFYGTVIDDYFPKEPRRVYNRPGKDIGWIYDRRILKNRRKAVSGDAQKSRT